MTKFLSLHVCDVKTFSALYLAGICTQKITLPSKKKNSLILLCYECKEKINAVFYKQQNCLFGATIIRAFYSL